MEYSEDRARRVEEFEMPGVSFQTYSPMKTGSVRICDSARGSFQFGSVQFGSVWFSSVQFGSVRFNVISPLSGNPAPISATPRVSIQLTVAFMRSGKPVCAPARPSEVFSMLPFEAVPILISYPDISVLADWA